MIVLIFSAPPAITVAALPYPQPAQTTSSSSSDCDWVDCCFRYDSDYGWYDIQGKDKEKENKLESILLKNFLDSFCSFTQVLVNQHKFIAIRSSDISSHLCLSVKNTSCKPTQKSHMLDFCWANENGELIYNEDGVSLTFMFVCLGDVTGRTRHHHHYFSLSGFCLVLLILLRYLN